MTKKLLLAAVAAALGSFAFQASAELPFSPRAYDENDSSWLYQPSGTAKIVRDAGPIGAPFVPSLYDENDTSWMYVAPPYVRKARGESASAGSSASPSAWPFVPSMYDENDTSWMYAPPRKAR